MKHRITVSIDRALYEYAKTQGFKNMSALVEEALIEKLGRELLKEKLQDFQPKEKSDDGGT